MKKSQILKLKKALFAPIMDICPSDDGEYLAAKINAIIDEHYDESSKKPKSKPYLATTGEENKNIQSVVRTKGQSEKADAIRGFTG